MSEIKNTIEHLPAIVDLLVQQLGMDHGIIIMVNKDTNQVYRAGSAGLTLEEANAIFHCLMDPNVPKNNLIEKISAGNETKQ